MIKKCFPLLIFVTSVYKLCAQDSLVQYKDLVFNSAFEREAITNYIQKPGSNYIDIFLAVDPAITPSIAADYRQKFQNIITTIKDEKYLKKSNDKKIKKLYEKVHETMLKKYEAQNHFSEVFKSGYYNCVSSSILYGLVFQQLNIPFTAKEKPTHVYLMSYPESDQIIVETTDPSGDFLKHSDRYKSLVVDRLKENKLISQQEFNSKSVNELFNQFYFPDHDINLKELIGIQYMNDALYKFDKEQYEEGYHQLEKAYFFYPKENMSTMLLVLNVQLLNTLNYEDIKSMKYLAELSRYEGLGLSQENILAEFERMTQKQLTNKADTATYRQYYEKFIALSGNETLNKEISYIYNLRRGLALYNTGNYEMSLPFLELAYELNPKNLDINRIYISALGQQLNYESDNHNIIEKLETEYRHHPELIDNTIFLSMLANAYVIGFGQGFELNNEKEALKYKALFEKYFTNDLNVLATNIGRAYSLAAVYYFRKGNTLKAKQLISQGLKYAPGNYELLSRQRMIH